MDATRRGFLKLLGIVPAAAAVAPAVVQALTRPAPLNEAGALVIDHAHLFTAGGGPFVHLPPAKPGMLYIVKALDDLMLLPASEETIDGYTYFHMVRFAAVQLVGRNDDAKGWWIL
jgi:hypothetical protein